jgi:hypothetical protein
MLSSFAFGAIRVNPSKRVFLYCGSRFTTTTQGRTRARIHILLRPSRTHHPLDSWHVAQSLFDIWKAPPPFFSGDFRFWMFKFSCWWIWRVGPAWHCDPLNVKQILSTTDWSGPDPDPALLGFPRYNSTGIWRVVFNGLDCDISFLCNFSQNSWWHLC